VKRILVTAALLAALVAVAAGCGEKEDSTGKPRVESVDLMLDFFPTPTTSASTRRSPMATSRRRAEGHAAHASDPSAPLKLLAAGKADLAISYEPSSCWRATRG
jgi:putative hydroxymethylpyrimidine transport system substrate-binding protein